MRRSCGRECRSARLRKAACAEVGRVLDCIKLVQAERHGPRDVRLFTQVVGALVVLLVLVSASVSACDSLHRALHRSDSGQHLCLACSLAKGHVDPATGGALMVLLVLGLLVGVHLADSLVPTALPCRFSRSRAPPVH